MAWPRMYHVWSATFEKEKPKKIGPSLFRTTFLLHPIVGFFIFGLLSRAAICARDKPLFFCVDGRTECSGFKLQASGIESPFFFELGHWPLEGSANTCGLLPTVVL